MNTMKRITGSLMAAVLMLAITHSCSKEDTLNIDQAIPEAELKLAQDDALVDALYEEIDNAVIDEVTQLDANAYSTFELKSTSDEDPCYTVNVDFPDSTHFPKVVTIDYGEGCTMVFRNDTITRSGKIIITVTGRWFEQGTQHIVTFDNFFINGVGIEGTRTITNQGLNEKGHLLISIKLEGGVVAFTESEIMTLEADYLREWIRYRTPLLDTMIITGSASGVNIQGESFTRTIVEPLVLVHCREYRWLWVIVDGIVEINNSVSGITSVDYSAEGCDGTVIFNRNGYRHNYPFKYNHRHHHENHGGGFGQ